MSTRCSYCGTRTGYNENSEPTKTDVGVQTVHVWGCRMHGSRWVKGSGGGCVECMAQAEERRVKRERAKEREACAKICDDRADAHNREYNITREPRDDAAGLEAEMCGQAIRKGGE